VRVFATFVSQPAASSPASVGFFEGLLRSERRAAWLLFWEAAVPECFDVSAPSHAHKTSALVFTVVFFFFCPTNTPSFVLRRTHHRPTHAIILSPSSTHSKAKHTPCLLPILPGRPPPNATPNTTRASRRVVALDGGRSSLKAPYLLCVLTYVCKC